MLTVVAAAAAAALTMPSPAAAHDNWNTVWNGSGSVLIPVTTGGVKNNHGTVWNEDRLGDGLGTRTWYVTANNGLDYVGDANGSKSGRGQENSFDGSRIVRFQVCVGPLDNERCTVWTPA